MSLLLNSLFLKLLAIKLTHTSKSRHFYLPTFTDLLKFRLMINVKDFSSPIQDGKKEE